MWIENFGYQYDYRYDRSLGSIKLYKQEKLNSEKIQYHENKKIWI